MIAERIKMLRENTGMTQADVARKLNVTRSSVNAWELGISVPSTVLLVELAQLFDVSTDYLLGIGSTSTLDVSGLSDDDVRILHDLAQHLRAKK